MISKHQNFKILTFLTSKTKISTNFDLNWPKFWPEKPNYWKLLTLKHQNFKILTILTSKTKISKIFDLKNQNFDYFDLKNQFNENFWSQNTKISKF